MRRFFFLSFFTFFNFSLPDLKFLFSFFILRKTATHAMTPAATFSAYPIY